MGKIDSYKRLAFENLSSKIETLNDFEEAICQWWRRKYTLCDTDQRYLDKYVDDMIVEYFEDHFRDNPQELEAYKRGFESVQEMEKDSLRKILGEDYTDEISYLQPPTTLQNTEYEPEEEVLMDLRK